MSKRLTTFHHIVNHLGVMIASKFVPVASIFLYSHYMSVYDYGVLNLASSYLWIFGIVMTLNLHTGIGRYIYTETDDFPCFLGTTLLVIAAIFLVCSVVIITNLGRFEQLLALRRDVILLTLVVVLGVIAESIFMQVYIHGQKSSQLLKMVSTKAVGALILSIILLFVLDKDKFLAVLFADTVVGVVTVAYVLYNVRASLQLKISFEHLRYMVQYSVPLIPYMLCLTLLSQFDRVMIDRYFGKEETGFYSLAYNIGILLLLVVTALLNVFSRAFFESVDRKDYVRVIKDSNAIFALAVLLTVVLILFGEEIFGLLVPAKYAPALDLIPLVAIGGLCSVIFQIWARVIAYANKTYLISIIAVLATGLKIGLNMLLLPIYGYKVAAVTTIAAYLVMSLSCVVVVNKVIRLFKVNILYEVAALGALAVVMLFFRNSIFAPAVEYSLKVSLLIIVVMLVKGNIFGLLARQQATVPSA
jgi:O-antigen/teichoic acid export membrane protein